MTEAAAAATGGEQAGAGGAMSAASIMAAADAAGSAFLERAGAAPVADAPQESEASEAKPGATGKPPGAGANAGAPEGESKADDKTEPKKLQRLQQRPTNSHDAWRSRFKARAEAKQQAQQPAAAPARGTTSEAVAAGRQELERMRDDGASGKQLAELQTAIANKDVAAIARLSGWESVEAMTRHFITGKTDAPAKDPKAEQRFSELESELKALREEKAQERKAQEERAAQEREQREFDEQLGWLREVAETHEVDSIKHLIKSSHKEVSDTFLRHAHSILEQDANLPIDEVFGLVLDNYKPVAESLLPVFPELIEQYIADHPEVLNKFNTKPRSPTGGPQGLKPDAARGSVPSRERTRQSDADRRGSTDEGAEASDKTDADTTETLSADNAQDWAEKKQRSFLQRFK